jgi:cysteine-rich repeat protein
MGTGAKRGRLWRTSGTRPILHPMQKLRILRTSTARLLGTTCVAAILSLSLTPGATRAAPIETDLSTWTVIQYEHNSQSNASWVLSENNTVVTQVVDADPSILLGDFTIENTEVVGTLRINTSSDDVLVGFVFGYQSRCAFYLFDWKKAAQQSGPTFGFADVGMSVKVINTCPDDPGGLDLWQTPPSPGPLLRHNQIPWAPFATYQYRLVFTPGVFSIEITRVSDGVVLENWTIEDTSYLTGSFGFYNSSQAQAVYADLTVEADPLCGNGTLNEGEDCDDGNTLGGDCCAFNCVAAAHPTARCSQPVTGDGIGPKASDCLYILRGAVGSVTCCNCPCDVDSSGTFTATDALLCLRRAVGGPVEVHCAECP